MVIRKNRSDVTFVFRPERPVKDVAVVGSFNGWDPEQGRMAQTKGEFRRRFKLQPGNYEYKFVVDGEWRTDPDASQTVRNSFGSDNSLLQLA